MIRLSLFSILSFAILLGACGLEAPLASLEEEPRASTNEKPFDSTIIGEETVDALDVYYIQRKIFEPKCVQCHNANDHVPDLTKEGVVASLLASTGLRHSDHNDEKIYVIRGNAANSLLYRKLIVGGGVGSRMPLDGPYLSRSEISLVRDWINRGAP